MKKIFLDCGTHLCEGLKDFINKGILTKEFEVHTFEANPSCNIKERIKTLPIQVTAHEKAVWVKDGTIFFNQENHTKSGSGSPNDGTSNIDGWGSSIEGIGFIHPGYETKVEVESISFSNFIEKLPEDSLIICKMDIEGSEFRVLRDLIDNDTITKINEIYVEFHERFMTEESLETRNELISIIEPKGVKVHQWF
jgi:FkbM family methyltransferase